MARASPATRVVLLALLVVGTTQAFVVLLRLPCQRLVRLLHQAPQPAPPRIASLWPLAARRKEESAEEEQEEEEDMEVDPLDVGSSFPMDPPELLPEEASPTTTSQTTPFMEILVGPAERSDAEGEGAAPAVAAANDRYFIRTDVPYYFLRDELGLGEARMLRVSLDHGQVLALSVQRSLRPKVAWLREALQLSRAEAAQLVGAAPNVLLLSVEDNLMPKLRWLRDELALSDADRRRLVLRCPQLLTASTGSLLLKLAFLEDDVGLTPHELGRAVRTMPPLLVLSLDTLVDKAEFLTHELGMTMKDVGFLLVRSPALFFQALDTGLKPKVRFLKRDLGLANPQIRALVLKAPRLLNYRVAARGKALLAYLTRPPFDMAKEDAVKLVLKAPTLLGTDVGGMRFQEAVQALKAATGSGTERLLAGVVQRFPGALALTATRIRSAQAMLMAPPLACSPDEVAEVLRKHPQALGYRPEAVRAKLAAVAAAYGQAPDDAAVKAALLKAPALLSYSLDGRLRPRLAEAAAAGVGVEKAVTMLSLPAGRFEERLDRSAAGSLPELPPLLRTRANARLRKLLVAQQKERRVQEGKGGPTTTAAKKRGPAKGKATGKKPEAEDEGTD